MYLSDPPCHEARFSVTFSYRDAAIKPDSYPVRTNGPGFFVHNRPKDIVKIPARPVTYPVKAYMPGFRVHSRTGLKIEDLMVALQVDKASPCDFRAQDGHTLPRSFESKQGRSMTVLDVRRALRKLFDWRVERCDTIELVIELMPTKDVYPIVTSDKERMAVFGNDTSDDVEQAGHDEEEQYSFDEEEDQETDDEDEHAWVYEDEQETDGEEELYFL